MLSRLCKQNYSKNVALFTGGLASGFLGNYAVKWYRERNHFPTEEISILTITNGEHVVKKIPSSALRTYLSYEELNVLRTSVGWKERTEKIWKGVTEKSAHLVFVKEGDALVGSACVIGNGRMGMICDVLVHPNYQHKGIGTLMMNHLVEELKKEDYAHIGLFGWEENQGVLKFYGKFGLIRNYFAMEGSSEKLKIYMPKPPQ
jgi:GNAT superfamily N-acetyltransferase